MLSIISDRGAEFTSRFWRSFKKGLGTKLKLSTTFQTQTDGQAERTSETLDDILRVWIIYFKGNGDKHLTLMEFAYNNSFHSSNSMDPYEALYRRSCMSAIQWLEVGEPSLLGPDLVYKYFEKFNIIRNQLQTTYSQQSLTPIIGEGIWSLNKIKRYLKISPIKGVFRFVKKRKLSPRYVGPCEIFQRVCKVFYELKLPSELTTIYPIFHVSILKICIGDTMSILPI